MKKGIILAIAANILWGLFPVYWKALAAVPSIEILAHRVVWSFLFLAVLLTWRRGWPAIRAKLRDRRTLGAALATSVIIGLNWLTYIYTVNSGRVVESALGYFLYPLVTVSLGVVFLRERLRPAQAAATALAGGGVLYMTVSYGTVPWLALALAVSFGAYSLLRKTIALGALEGLTFETGALGLLAVPFLLALAGSSSGAFGRTPSVTVLLAGAGLVTALPLLLFISGARRISLAAAGFLNYISSSLQFVLGVFVYREPFDTPRLIGFLLIWAALAIYSIDLARAVRTRAAAAAAAAEAPA